MIAATLKAGRAKGTLAGPIRAHRRLLLLAQPARPRRQKSAPYPDLHLGRFAGPAGRGTPPAPAGRTHAPCADRLHGPRLLLAGEAPLAPPHAARPRAARGPLGLARRVDPASMVRAGRRLAFHGERDRPARRTHASLGPGAPAPLRPARVATQPDFRGASHRHRRAWRAAFPELRDVPWYPAIGDGAASNLGSGAVHPGVAAINIGTSAALRVIVRPAAPNHARRSRRSASSPIASIPGGSCWAAP